MNPIEDWKIHSALALTLTPGDILRTDDYTIHRYETEWWILWTEPSKTDLGRIIETDDMLRNFLKGNDKLGRRIPLLQISELL